MSGAGKESRVAGVLEQHWGMPEAVLGGQLGACSWALRLPSIPPVPAVHPALAPWAIWALANQAGGPWHGWGPPFSPCTTAEPDQEGKFCSPAVVHLYISLS